MTTLEDRSTRTTLIDTSKPPLNRHLLLVSLELSGGSEGVCHKFDQDEMMNSAPSAKKQEGS